MSSYSQQDDYVFSSFLTYKNGIYHRPIVNKHFHALKGNHVVKILGWEKNDDDKGLSFWIIQNVWGKDWGENGYGKIAMGETLLDQFAIGSSAYPLPMIGYYKEQEKNNPKE